MHIFIGVLVSIAIVIVVNFIFEYISSRKEKAETNIVRLPKIYAIIGFVCFIAILALMIASILLSGDCFAWFIMLFSVFLFMCLFLVFSPLNWRIKYDDETFEYRTSFRHTLKFKYSDIIKVHRTKVGTILIKVRKRYLTIDSYADGKAEFLEKVYIKMMRKKMNHNRRSK